MKSNLLTPDEIKKQLGKRAAEYVEPGMLVGLGTGSTSLCFIESLIARCRQGLEIKAIASSLHSQEVAQKGGIPMVNVNEITSIDLTIDGADEVDPKKRLIKGGGGAHVREKILAQASKRYIILVDESKLVPVLGKFGVPIEILPFGVGATVTHIQSINYTGKLRLTKEHTPFITDNGNYIFDLHTPQRFPHPEKDHEKLVNIAGVVDTGFFFGLPVELLVGSPKGGVEFRE